MQWGDVAGGRCLGTPWRVAIAGVDRDDPQRVCLLDEEFWQWVCNLLPYEELTAYGLVNGFSFTPLRDSADRDFDAFLLIPVECHSGSYFSLDKALRYLLSLDVDRGFSSEYEQAFKRIFLACDDLFSVGPRVHLNPAFDFSLACKKSPLLEDGLARAVSAGKLEIDRFFSYCESSERAPGWLSSCWLDCFYNGTIPVHLADWSVPSWIPEDCYVDGRLYADRQALDRYLKGISPERYAMMLESWQRFLDGPDSYPYSMDAWINSLTSVLAFDAVEARAVAPLISVIIPAYNYGRFLGQAISSVLSQGVGSLEVLVLDNASDDNTSEVVKPFLSDSRVRYMRNRRNIGPSHNVLNGMRIASGEFFTVLMADDVILDGHFDRLLPLMRECPDAVLGYAPVSFIDEIGRSLGELKHPGYRGASYVGGRNEAVDLLVYDNYITPSATVVRAQTFRDCWRWNPKLRGAGDWDMVVQLAGCSNNFVFVNSPGVGYRLHGDQHSADFYASNAPLEDHLLIVEGVFQRGQEVCLSGAERDVAAHLRRRLSLYPDEEQSPLGERVRLICKRLEELAGLDEVVLFSIILTTYNRPALLKDALTSIAQQTLRDFEVILVNDHGEPVEHLLADFDMPITYLRQGRNQGLSAARNTGLQVARGRYITYLDDDDIYRPTHLAELAEAFEKHPQSVVYTGVEYVSERLDNGQRIELKRGQPFAHPVFDRERLFVQNYIPVNTWAHPKGVLTTVGGFDPGLSAFEDWDMLLRLAARYEFVHIPKVTAEVRVRDSGNTDEHMLGRERNKFPELYKRLYRRHPGSGSEALRQARQQLLDQLEGREATEPAPTVQQWLTQREPTAVQQGLIDAYLSQQATPQRIAVVVRDTGNAQALSSTLASIEACAYPHVQSHVVSDNSVASLNTVVEQLSAEWFVVLNSGDQLTPTGLLMVGLELQGAPDCRAVYADHLHRLPEGELGAVLLPGFNLDLLLEFPVLMARFWLFNRACFLQLGGFEASAGSAFELQLITRMIEDQGMAGLGHIDEPLLITEPTVLGDNPDERAVIETHLRRRGFAAQIVPGLPGRYRIHYGAVSEARISIIVNTAGASLARLQRCLETVLEKTAYPHYQIVVADSSTDQATQAWLDALSALGEPRLQRVKAASEAQAVQLAAAHAQTECLVFLSPEAAIIDAAWLDELLNHAQRPEVGIVGAKLLTAEGRIAQAGQLLGLNGDVAPAFAGCAVDEPGYLQRLQLDQTVSAVSADCLMIKTEVFTALQGFADGLGRYAAVDLCLRAREQGYLTVLATHALVMCEGQANPVQQSQEQEELYRRHLAALAHDPAYNRNLSLRGSGFALETNPDLAWRPLSWRPAPVVLAYPGDPWGCGHYRVIQPFNALQASAAVEGVCSLASFALPEVARIDPDVVIFQRPVQPDGLESLRRVAAFTTSFKVYELDDYLPNTPMKSAHRAHMPKDLLKTLRQGLECVDRFVVSTEALAEQFSGLHADIQVVKNCLPTSWWQGLQSQRQQGRKPRVGWAGGMGHTGDLELIADVVKALANEVEWVFFGMCPEKIRPFVHEFHPGVDIASYPRTLAKLNLDLALAPVEQNLFNECKSNLRLLEYGACGVPVICSDVRCYQGDDLPVTRVKNRYKDWLDAIHMHLADLSATAKAGDALQQAVRGQWMLQGDNLERWRQAWLPK